MSVSLRSSRGRKAVCAHLAFIGLLAPLPELAGAAQPDAAQLSSIEVNAPALRDAQSEGSDSYRATAATVGGKEAVPIVEIPHSVSIVTRRRMDDQNMYTIDEALREVTGVTVTPWDGATFQIRSRGYSMESSYDGIPSWNGLNATQQFDLAMFDRIEVLRGPAGIFQGSGQPGGTVNFVRKRGLREFGGSASASAGSWSNYHADAEVGGPLNKEGTLRSRVVVAGQDRDYFYSRAHGRKGMVYGTLDYDLTPSTQLSLYGGYQDDRTNPYMGQPAYTSGRFLDAPRGYNPLAPWSVYDTTTSQVAAEVDHRFTSGWAWRTRLSHGEQQWNIRDGYPLNGVNPVTGRVAGYRTRGWDSNSTRDALDTYVSGPVDALGRRHELTVGFNWERYENRTQYAPSADVANVPSANPGFVAEPTIPPFERGTQDVTRQSGLYGQARISLADPLTLVLGARVSNFATQTRNVAPSAVTDWREGAKENGQVSPYAALVAHVARNTTVYASFSDIFMPQTARDVNGRVLEPRVGKQMEVGVKHSMNDGKLTASASAFRTRDVNRSLPDALNPGFFVQAGQVEVKGWEVEFAGRPFANLDMTLGYTNLLSSYTAHQTLAGTPFTLFEPRHSLKLYGHYRFGQSRWSAGGGVRVSSGGVGGGVAGLREQGGYTVASAQVGYALDARTRISLTINNLFDRHYYERVGGMNTYNTWGEPRSVTVAVRTRF
jgi:outer membrane receptor for ferric coprogen and ferric-rhodotorulic acid